MIHIAVRRHNRGLWRRQPRTNNLNSGFVP